MKLRIMLSLALCLMLLAGCGRLPTQDVTSGGSSTVPVESSTVSPEDPAQPDASAPGSSTVAPEVSVQPEPEEPTPADPDTSVSEAPGEQPAPAESETPPETPSEPTHWLTVGSGSAQSSPYSFTVPEDGVYTFQLQGQSSATLELYVLEAPFEDGIRYLPQAYRPVSLSAEGSLSLKAGWQVYCFSSTGSFSAGSSTVLLVDYTGGTVQQGDLSQTW